jgi:hypothetical protein
MKKLESGFFWGVLAGVAAVAIAAAVVWSECFRPAKAGGPAAAMPKAKKMARPAKAGRAQRKR